MPEGSSSEAPVMRPGPSRARKPWFLLPSVFSGFSFSLPLRLRLSEPPGNDTLGGYSKFQKLILRILNRLHKCILADHSDAVCSCAVFGCCGAVWHVACGAMPTTWRWRITREIFGAKTPNVTGLRRLKRARDRDYRRDWRRTDSQT